MYLCYLAVLMALALFSCLFVHPIVDFVILAAGLMLPILPAWGRIFGERTFARISHWFWLPLLPLALPLGACSTISRITGATVTQKQAAAAVAAYNVAESAANVYLAL